MATVETKTFESCWTWDDGGECDGGRIETLDESLALKYSYNDAQEELEKRCFDKLPDTISVREVGTEEWTRERF